MNAEIRSKVEHFANEIANLFRTQLLAAFNMTGAVRRHLRSEAKHMVAPTARKPGLRADGAPLQLCPVPRCTNAAAPSLGMVCAKHKNVSKNTIAKYRAARKAAALKARKAKAS